MLQRYNLPIAVYESEGNFFSFPTHFFRSSPFRVTALQCDSSQVTIPIPKMKFYIYININIEFDFHPCITYFGTVTL